VSKTYLAAAALAFSTLPLSATAQTALYQFILTGAQEVPANTSPASGFAKLVVDADTDIVTLQLAAMNLSGALTNIDLRAAPAGSDGTSVASMFSCCGGSLTLYGSPLPNSLQYIYQRGLGLQLDTMIIAAPYNYYLNVSTTAYPDGELRGQLAPVPEPGTYALMAIGVGLVGAAVRRRRPS
jgi:CHRD domain/PEP-CTERM motif